MFKQKLIGSKKQDHNRQRDRQRQTDRQRERQRERGIEICSRAKPVSRSFKTKVKFLDLQKTNVKGTRQF